MSSGRSDAWPIQAAAPAFLDSTAQQAALLLRATGSGFYVCAPENGPAQLVVSHNLTGTPWDEELPGRVFESRKAILETPADQPPVLAVPAIWDDRVRGVLMVVDDAPGRSFDQQDVALLQPLADLAASMLRQADRLARITAQFRALHVIDVALTSSVQLDRVLGLILDNAVGLVGAEHGSLRLLNPDTGELVLKAHVGEGWTPEVRAYTFPIGHGITGLVAQTRVPYLCPDVRQDLQNVVLFDEMHSGVAVPLLLGAQEADERKELLGVLLLESTRPATFDRHDVELLQALAQEAVIAIQNATQRQKLQLLRQTLQDEQERRLAAEKWTVMGQAATALAHRINNLIGIVPASAGEVRRALAELQMPPADREWIEANLDRIQRNSHFVLRLADALFRPFQEPGPRARFDVNRLLNEALQAAHLNPTLPGDATVPCERTPVRERCPAGTEVQVLQDYAQRLPEVESNSLLVDVFLELITNAQKAMEGQPRKCLELRTRLERDEAGSWVVAEVSDTGIGFTPEQMVHLWDMFQQSTDGLGFGLWWVRTFIEQQGGTIACDSRPGAGATFTVCLPSATYGEHDETS